MFIDLKKKPLALWIILVLIFLMFGDIFFVKKASDFIFILIFFSLFFVNKYFKIDGRVSVIIGLIFLAFCPFLMFFSQELAEKAGIWAFLLIFSAIVLIYFESKEKR